MGNESLVRRKDYDRGRIEKVVLKKPFTLNGVLVTEAIIEVDHINYGLDKKTLKLNKKRRSNFNTRDIEQFLQMLDGEFLPYTKINGRILRYEVRIQSPIQGKFKDKEFILVFETHFDMQGQIHTITLFPRW